MGISPWQQQEWLRNAARPGLKCEVLSTPRIFNMEPHNGPLGKDSRIALFWKSYISYISDSMFHCGSFYRQCSRFCGKVYRYILPDSLVFCSSTASLWSQIPTPFATQTAMNTEGLFTEAFIASRIMVELGLFDPYSWGI